jgi:histidine triad (HIT) family protein
MTECDICRILENKDSFKLFYEDDLCFALLHESPSTEGHSLVIPKKHYPILEEIPEKTLEHIFNIANQVSIALFDTLKATGTNIIVNNGISAGQELPHFLINIIPRKDNDKLDFEWKPKEVSEDQLKTILSMIQTFSDAIFKGEEYKRIKIKQDEELEEKEDYFIKQLKRIP